MELNQNLHEAVSQHNISISRNGCKRVMMNSVVRTTVNLLIAFKLTFSQPLTRIVLGDFASGISFPSIYP